VVRGKKVLSGATMTGNNVNLEEQLVERISASGQFSDGSQFVPARPHERMV